MCFRGVPAGGPPAAAGKPIATPIADLRPTYSGMFGARFSSKLTPQEKASCGAASLVKRRPPGAPSDRSFEMKNESPSKVAAALHTLNVTSLTWQEIIDVAFESFKDE